MEKQSFSRKAPNRSKISDRELSEKIKRERAERPSEFVASHSGPSRSARAYSMSSANEVIAKWL